MSRNVSDFPTSCIDLNFLKVDSVEKDLQWMSYFGIREITQSCQMLSMSKTIDSEI